MRGGEDSGRGDVTVSISSGTATLGSRGLRVGRKKLEGPGREDFGVQENGGAVEVHRTST